VTDALDATLSFLSPLDEILTYSSALVMMNVVLRVYCPLLLETLDELYYAATSEMRHVLPIVTDRLLDAKNCREDEILRHCASWVLGMVIDEMAGHARNSCNADAEWVYTFINKLEKEHSTAALVKMSLNLQLSAMTE
jgi:hypothetical protein